MSSLTTMLHDRLEQLPQSLSEKLINAPITRPIATVKESLGRINNKYTFLALSSERSDDDDLINWEKMRGKLSEFVQELKDD